MFTKKTIIAEIFKGVSFSENELEEIVLKFKKIKKGKALITPNMTVNSQFYVADGCFRSYYLDKKTKEHTLQFAVKN